MASGLNSFQSRTPPGLGNLTFWRVFLHVWESDDSVIWLRAFPCEIVVYESQTGINALGEGALEESKSRVAISSRHAQWKRRRSLSSSPVSCWALFSSLVSSSSSSSLHHRLHSIIALSASLVFVSSGLWRRSSLILSRANPMCGPSSDPDPLPSAGFLLVDGGEKQGMREGGEGILKFFWEPVRYEKTNTRTEEGCSPVTDESFSSRLVVNKTKVLRMSSFAVALQRKSNGKVSC